MNVSQLTKFIETKHLNLEKHLFMLLQNLSILCKIMMKLKCIY